MRTAHRTLLRKLLTMLVLPTLVVVVSFGLLDSGRWRRELLREADRELEDEVSVLKAAIPALASSADARVLAHVTEAMATRQRVHGIALYGHDCRPIFRSPELEAAAAVVDQIACDSLTSGRAYHDRVAIDRTSALVRTETLGDSPRVGLVLVTYYLGEVEAMIRRSDLYLAVAGLALLAGLAVVAFVLARSFLRPLGALIRAAERVSAGDLSVRVEPARPREMKPVLDAFNRMMDNLVEAQRRLLEAEERHRDFELRTRHAHTLSVVGKVAASIAHEVSSPLSIILGWARIAASDPALPAASRDQAQEITKQCERITRILRHMVGVARYPEETRAQVDLLAVVREAVAFLAPECRQHGIRVALDLPTAVPPLWAERDALVQVLLNLCLNAVQAQAHRGGVLAITVRETEARVITLEVRDAGPGIPAEVRPRVFELFFSTRREKGGAGLGLPIVADILKRLQGRISFSDAPEGGCAVTVALPVLDQPPTLAAALAQPEWAPPLGPAPPKP